MEAKMTFKKSAKFHILEVMNILFLGLESLWSFKLDIGLGFFQNWYIFFSMENLCNFGHSKTWIKAYGWIWILIQFFLSLHGNGNKISKIQRRLFSWLFFLLFLICNMQDKGKYSPVRIYHRQDVKVVFVCTISRQSI